jgi:NAD(P)-dependent dehydrogenase (short-subunit alcohol dehydrogenase family)
MGKLDGKVAVVTGAAKGMGLGCARVFARHGARLALVNRSPEVLGVAEELRASGCEAIAFDVDVRDAKGLGEAYAIVDDRFGRIDILVNAAGVASAGAFEEFEEAELERIMEINFRGIWNSCKAAIPYMLRGGYGKIVNFASVTGCMVSDPGMTAYSASKGAVLALTRSLAAEYAARNISANAILPGGIDTPMIDRFCAQACPEDPGSVKALIAGNVPMGRLGTIEEAGEVAAFLASSESNYVTGTSIVFDGGSTLPESSCTDWS